ncbi:MAG: DNA polymerase III subunit delta [Chitinophagaceae bacterium]|jgi:DNA polymerase-3 subunit delta
MADFKQIIDSIKNKSYAPVYVLDGEEPYYLDKLMTLFEDQILSPAEKEFNMTVLYGRDTRWQEVVNACRRFPMFAERQVVLLKDAAAMPEFGELLGYFQHPSPTTIFVVEYRNKKIDGKTNVAKFIKSNIVYFNSEKTKEEAMPAWTKRFGQEVGFEIPDREADMLTMYLGNNLQKIANEIEKIRINVPEEKVLSAALIQKHIGISREYNIFDFPEAFSSGNKEKTYRMLSYFLTNAKAAPMVLITASLYTHFSQLYKANYASRLPEKEWAGAIGTSPYYVKNVMSKTRKWPLHKVEECLITIAEYNAKSVGIDSGANDTELLKELMGKLELIEMMN